MGLQLSSPAFPANGAMDPAFTCDGQDLSPPLSWEGVPEGTQSLVLIVDDPDAPDPAAPRMTWVHWILYNIPPRVTALDQGIGPDDVPDGCRDGLNDWDRVGYGGPCPPVGTHRYFHKLYALDTVLPDLGLPTKAALEAAMQDHILEKAELIGTYQRKR